MRSSYTALVARKVGGILRTRPSRIDCDGGVVSFTFDDFPKSALANGARVLEKHGVRGTFYAALKLAGTANHLGPMFDHEDLQLAHQRGHEIACHTYSHLDCSASAKTEIAAEIDENSAAIAALTGAAPTSFAYPYGALSMSAKRLLAHRFSSCRGTGQGINSGAVDRADLLGIRIYDRCFDAAVLRRVIDETCASNGWVIFFTHDVREQPSEFGCKPEQLDLVAGYAARRALTLPVREVAATLD